ncbi:MAG: glycosyltransferase family 4 protein [Actinomycetia bacterium]|nr:glycosyltransferase family 4 protein [Actinomycetes bacterium]
MSSLPRLAVVVGNAVSDDSRVQRCAAAAARGGWQVTVLGRSPNSDEHSISGPGWTGRLLPLPPLDEENRQLLRERDRLAGHRPWWWRHGGWRRLDPTISALEVALAGPLEALGPDVIHANDRHTLPLAARSTALLRAAGRPTGWIADVHEDVLATADRGARGLRGWARRRMIGGEESEWIGSADAVLTVSDILAQRLQERHGLRTRPTVVMNAPLEPDRDADVAGLRTRIGLSREVPLLVYVGNCAPARGVSTVIDALPQLPAAHLAVIAHPADPGADRLMEQAAQRGVADRVHRIDFVPAEHVVALIRDADIGLVPLLHRPNHEISLITKYLEYLHAGIPVVCSDVRAMAEFTRTHDLGEVFAAGDTGGLVRAVESVLADVVSYRRRVTQSGAVRATAWAVQEPTLLGVYERVLRQSAEQDV